MDEPLRQNWLRRHRRGAALVSGLMVAALAIVIGVRQFATPSLSVPAGEVAVARAERGVFRDMTSLQGQIEPRDIIYLDAAEGGRVRRLFVRSGDHVAEGQPLVEFTNTTLELDILSQEARLIESITQQAVRGRLSLGADRPALLLPAGAFLEASGGRWVFVLAPGGGRAERRSIRIGRRNADQVEILAGLVPGDRVITSSYDGWDAYRRINLR